MGKKDSVTLEMVWGAAQAAARKHNCSIQEITSRQVQEHMPHGSDGCLAAFLRQVKIQDIDSKAFDLNVFSAGFKAGIVAEMRRFVDQAVEAARQEARVTEEIFLQVCNDLDEAKNIISVLRSEKDAIELRTNTEVRRLELELADTRARLTVNDEVKATLVEARDAAVTAHGEAREETTRLAGRVAEITKELGAEKARAFSLQQRLAESEQKQEATAKEAALAKQSAAHAESIAAEHKERLRDLREELSQFKTDRGELQARVSETLERLAKAETRAAVAEARVPPQKKPPSNGGTTTSNKTGVLTKLGDG